MKANEFCYWLQGYFEICEAQGLSTKLDGAAARCIEAHLSLVAKVEPDHSNVFVAWLNDHLRKPSPVGPDAVLIRRFLAAQFQHVIDPSYGGDQMALGKIHGTGGQSWPTDGLIRC
jgi:hypothetical protein